MTRLKTKENRNGTNVATFVPKVGAFGTKVTTFVPKVRALGTNASTFVPNQTTSVPNPVNRGNFNEKNYYFCRMKNNYQINDQSALPYLHCRRLIGMLERICIVYGI